MGTGGRLPTEQMRTGLLKRQQVDDPKLGSCCLFRPILMRSIGTLPTLPAQAATTDFSKPCAAGSSTSPLDRMSIRMKRLGADLGLQRFYRRVRTWVFTRRIAT